MRMLTILTAATLALGSAAYAGDYKAAGGKGHSCGYSAVTADAKATPKPEQTAQQTTTKEDAKPVKLAQSKPVTE
ncbi:MAG: hypothetical protein AAF439_07120 [Pseudomonadota bacterium]